MVEVNAGLSTGAIVTANGVKYTAGTLTDKMFVLYPGEKTASVVMHENGEQISVDLLKSLRVDFAKNVLTTTPPGLVPSETGDVKKNNAGNYPAGTYRAGAYAIEAVQTMCIADTPSTSLQYIEPAVFGANGAAVSELLWEVTVFWHRK